MKISGSYKTDVGSFRKNNQDAVLYMQKKSGEVLAAVCDGLGGHQCGEIASNMAIKMMKDFFEATDFSKLKHDVQIHDFLTNNINKIQMAMSDYSLINEAAIDMGTTMVIILIVNQKVYFVNIGDSRIYCFDNSNLKQLTIDHNVLNLYLKKQHPQTDEVALNHTYWKALTSALGPSKPLKTDIFHLPLKAPITFLLTSDGVHDFLAPEEIIHILQKRISIKAKVKKLINQALDNVSTDNVTALLVEIN